MNEGRQRLTFGKHRGERIEAMPRKYLRHLLTLQWFLNPWRGIVRRHLRTRSRDRSVRVPMLR